MPETSGTKLGSDTAASTTGSKSTTGSSSTTGRGPGGSMAASKASASRGSTEGARQGGGTSGNTSASRGPGGSMAAAKASSNPSGSSRNTQTAGPNRGLAGTSSQSGVAGAKASAPQQSRGILKDQSRVPASTQVSTPRNMVEQARINNLKDQYARYGEAYRTIAPPPALPGAPGAPRVLNPQRDVAMSSLPGPGTTWPGQGSVPQGALTAIRPAQPGIADRIVSAFTGPSTLGQRTPQPTSRFANPAQPASAAQMAAPPPQAGLSSARVPRLPEYQVIGATIQNILNNGPMPGSPIAKLSDWWNGANDQEAVRQTLQPGLGRPVPFQSNYTYPGGFTYNAQTGWTRHTTQGQVFNTSKPSAPVRQAAQQPPQTQKSDLQPGRRLPQELSDPPVAGPARVVGPATAPPADLSRNPYETSYARPALGNPMASGGPQTQKKALEAIKSAIENVRYNYPQPAGPEGGNVASLDAPLPGTSGPTAPSQQAGQPQSIGEAWNRYQYEKNRASEGLSSLPQRILEAVLGGNISGNTILGPRDAERGDKGNREMNQLLLNEINRILATSAPASTSRPIVAGPNQSQLDLVLNTFL